MRTNVVNDDELITAVLKSEIPRQKNQPFKQISGFLQVSSQKKIKKLKGKMDWYGDLDDMRQD